MIASSAIPESSRTLRRVDGAGRQIAAARKADPQRVSVATERHCGIPHLRHLHRQSPPASPATNRRPSKPPPSISSSTRRSRPFSFTAIDDRKGMQSVFNGPAPVIRAFDDADAEAEAVAAWINERIKHDAIQPHEIGVFVRSAAAFDRGGNAVARAGANANILDDHVETKIGHVSIGTMHLAKGLEFRAVAVMACDDEVIPSQERIEAAADESDLEEVYNTERHLLYVACTRARDHLLLSGVAPVSEFLEDMARQRVQRAP